MFLLQWRQGQSFRHVSSYFPQPIFSQGQLYVIILSVTSCTGLKILILDLEEQVSNATFHVVYKDFF